MAPLLIQTFELFHGWKDTCLQGRIVIKSCRLGGGKFKQKENEKKKLRRMQQKIKLSHKKFIT
jgi:hypothetical protein